MTDTAGPVQVTQAEWKRTTEDGKIAYVHASGAKVIRFRPRTNHSNAKYMAIRADGSKVRVNRNADGSPYVARPWHGPADLPIIHWFTSPSSAKRSALASLNPSQDGERGSVDEIARRAMAGAEVARTDVVKPVNGTAPYTVVIFRGQRIEFHDDEWTIEQHRDAGSSKAAAYAQAINDGLFQIAQRAVAASENRNGR